MSRASPSASHSPRRFPSCSSVSVLLPPFLRGISLQTLVYTNATTFVICIFFNYGTARGQLGGYSIGRVADFYTTLVSPAGWALSIWAFIYIGMTAFCVWGIAVSKQATRASLRTTGTRATGARQIGQQHDDYSDAETQARYDAAGETPNAFLIRQQIGFYFISANFFNPLWIVLWCQGRPVAWIWAASFALLALTCSLAKLSVRAQFFRRFYSPQSEDGSLRNSVPPLDQLLVLEVPFSIYFGWTTVATILNFSCAVIGSDALLTVEVDSEEQPNIKLLYFLGLAQHVWAIIILILAGGFFTFITFWRKTQNFAYPFVLVWSALAISAECENTKGSLVRSVEGSIVRAEDAEAVGVCARWLAGVMGCVGALGVVNFGMRTSRAGR